MGEKNTEVLHMKVITHGLGNSEIENSLGENDKVSILLYFTQNNGLSLTGLWAGGTVFCSLIYLYFPGGMSHHKPGTLFVQLPMHGVVVS